MNFLNFLTSGAGIFSFNLQNLTSDTRTNTLLRSALESGSFNKDESQNSEKKQTLPQTISSQKKEELEKILTPSQIELLNQHQQLINQYMHLNIQLLSQKIQNLEKKPEVKEEPSSAEQKNSKKKIKKQNVNCGHNDREHYAKGMCNNCYHKNGRTKKPWKCSHSKLYANGLCQNCYINKYNQKKRQKNQFTQKQFQLQSQPEESRSLVSEAKIQAQE